MSLYEKRNSKVIDFALFEVSIVKKNPALLTHLHTNLFLLVVLILFVSKFKGRGTAGVSQKGRRGHQAPPTLTERSLGGGNPGCRGCREHRLWEAKRQPSCRQLSRFQLPKLPTQRLYFSSGPAHRAAAAHTPSAPHASTTASATTPTHHEPQGIHAGQECEGDLCGARTLDSGRPSVRLVCERRLSRRTLCHLGPHRKPAVSVSANSGAA